MLKITGRQIPRESSILERKKEDDGIIEFITSGTMRTRGNLKYISYDETEISGMEGCKTSLLISPGKVKMSRKGADLEETIMEFEKGKRFYGFYYTPYGNISMELLTNDMAEFVDSDGVEKLSIDYDISLKGLSESRNTLDIEITEAKDSLQ